ncbi:hypothetical protein [Vogesella sp. LIG4]|uniref:hypothetical protein n=1 Tax=Vogesella sp. LIG4 TaxID=1192162 RepID=UPI00081FC477|nr:hypothetical protein [Vogesella sp. LIG4]SCK22511.1 polar amino acid transport system substrate-binding protein [Vogesella sp. LIG4]
MADSLVKFPRAGLAVAVLLAAATSGAEPLRAAIRVPVYSEYSEPPFAAEGSNSLSLRLADWLTAHAAGAYVFQAVSLPRKRLSALIAQPGWQGLVLWANPVWFDDVGMRRYAWSQPLMQDVDLVISRQELSLEYGDLGHYTALRLGGIAGHRYADVDRLFADGQLQREDADSQLQNVFKLRRQRIDLTFIQASSLPYLLQQVPDLRTWAYFSRSNRGQVTRYCFADKDNRRLIGYVNAQIGLLQQDKTWQGWLKY